jgi:hypothetical protein
MRSTAGRLARRLGISRANPPALRVQVPRLRIAPGGAAEPTLWVIAPDWNRPAGGVRKLYRAVDVLNDAGVRAAIVHESATFSCTWFEHRTRIVAAADVSVGKDDVIVVPEIYWPTTPGLPSGIRQVIFNQNAYLTIDALASGVPEAAAPYIDNPDLAAVVVVSQENADVLEYAFPGLETKRIRHGFDPAVYHLPSQTPPKRIAYMPRRRADEAAEVLRLLDLRGSLEGWEVVAIEGSSETTVAEQLRSSRIFMSFSGREGFGLPPCEALACGCLVVGFDGFAGREFFHPPFAHSVENGDVVAFAKAVETAMKRTETDSANCRAAAEAGSRYVHERYSLAIERQDILNVFAPLVQP